STGVEANTRAPWLRISYRKGGQRTMIKKQQLRTCCKGDAIENPRINKLLTKVTRNLMNRPCAVAKKQKGVAVSRHAPQIFSCAFGQLISPNPIPTKLGPLTSNGT